MMIAWYLTVALWSFLAIALLMFGVLGEHPENYLHWLIGPFAGLWLIELVRLVLHALQPFL